MCNKGKVYDRRRPCVRSCRSYLLLSLPNGRRCGEWWQMLGRRTDVGATAQRAMEATRAQRHTSRWADVDPPSVIPRARQQQSRAIHDGQRHPPARVAGRKARSQHPPTHPATPSKAHPRPPHPRRPAALLPSFCQSPPNQHTFLLPHHHRHIDTVALNRIKNIVSHLHPTKLLNTMSSEQAV